MLPPHDAFSVECPVDQIVVVSEDFDLLTQETVPLHSFEVSVMLRSSHSVVAHPLQAGFSFQLWKATGFPSLEITAPNWQWLASAWMTEGSLMSGQASIASPEQ